MNESVRQAATCEVDRSRRERNLSTVAVVGAGGVDY